jgi:ABC-type multidrug transport system, ATPase and permease components
MKFLDRLARIRAESSVEANSRMIEYVQGIQVSKAFNQTGSKLQRFEQALRHYKQTNIDLVVKLAFPLTAFTTILELGFVIILPIRVLPLPGRQPHAEDIAHLPGSGFATLQSHQEYGDLSAPLEDYGCLPGEDTGGAG